MRKILAQWFPGLLNQQDPWRSRQTGSGGPPDLEAILSGFFKKHFKRASGGGSQPPENGLKLPVFKSVVAGFFLIWALSGIFVVQQAEQGVVTRFGRYVRTVGPGLHWIPRFIESRAVMNVEQVSQLSYGAPMLTKDENIVLVQLSVQYRIDDLRDYLFNVSQPVLSLNEATASALRQVVGHTELDDLLTTGREAVRNQIGEQLKGILAIYRPGLLVTKVSLQPAKPPEEVTDAFNDAIKAREDEQRYINQAQAYASKVLPIAQGQAVRIKQAAEAFSRQLVLEAQGRTAQFLALLPEYHRAPGVMRERMYLSTMESVLSHVSKVLVDLKGNQNMVYLPLDQLLHARQTTGSGVASHGNAWVAGEQAGFDQTLRDVLLDAQSKPAGVNQALISNQSSVQNSTKGGYGYVKPRS